MKLRNLLLNAGPFLWRCLRKKSRATLTPLALRLAAKVGQASRRRRLLKVSRAPLQKELHLARFEGLGDVLMCTPSLRDLKRSNPNCHVTFYNDYPSLVEGLPFIDAVRPLAEAPWRSTILLSYEESIPPQRHIAQIIGDHLGLTIEDVRPVCFIDYQERDQFLKSWENLPRPRIVLNRHASHWTPNKEWPEDHWEELIDRLLKWSSVIEIGKIFHPDSNRESNRYVSLIGRLSLRQLATAMAAADLHVGPISGPTHLAAAFRVPSVVIYGGYEHPVCSGYEENINLFSGVPCAPCWLRDPCPFNRLCLRLIDPATVDRALKQLWQPADHSRMA